MKTIKVDMNKIAKEVAALEGGAESQSIAQVKETLRCFGIVLHTMHPTEVLAVIQKLMK